MKNEKLIKALLNKLIFFITIISILYFFSRIFFPQNLGVNESIKEYYSLNKKCKAIVFLRQYNSITGSTINVSVMDASQEVGEKEGNVFIANTNSDDKDSVSIKWHDPYNMEILFYEANNKIIKSKSRIKNVSIKYY